MKKNIRKLHINNEEWHYQVGSGGGVIIYAPNSKVPIKINDVDWHNVDSVNSPSAITPATVKQYIITTVAPKRLKEGIE